MEGKRFQDLDRQQWRRIGLILLALATIIIFFRAQYARGETFKPVPYNFAAMVRTLGELTGWHNAHEWPPPEILQLQPEKFEERRRLNKKEDLHHYVGEYAPKSNQVFINLDCRLHALGQPEEYCQSALFHELVHWGQQQLGLSSKQTRAEAEQEADQIEEWYAGRIGLDLSPPRPTPRQLPQTEHLLILTPDTGRYVQKMRVSGQVMWIVVGTKGSFHMQLLGHRHRWIGVEIFEDWQLVEAWRDSGYIAAGQELNPKAPFPQNSTYQGKWVRLK